MVVVRVGDRDGWLWYVWVYYCLCVLLFQYVSSVSSSLESLSFFGLSQDNSIC